LKLALYALHDRNAFNLRYTVLNVFFYFLGIAVF